VTSRTLSHLAGSAVAGVLVGSGLAALADAPPNDACSDFGTLPEGSSSSGSVELWPLGLRCDYVAGGRIARAAFFGPPAAELYAWIVVAGLVAFVALRRASRGGAWRRAPGRGTRQRDRADARDIGIAMVVLAMSGVAWMYGDATFALFLPLVLGPPVVFALDRLLRPAVARSSRASLRVAVALPALAFCAMLVTIFAPLVGIACCLLAAGPVAREAAAAGAPRAAAG
jgi:hypothetical protein